MEYKILEKEKNEFEPFTIQITIENLAELKGLWARFNQSAVYDGDLLIAVGAYFNGDELLEDINKKLLKYVGDQL